MRSIDFEASIPRAQQNRGLGEPVVARETVIAPIRQHLLPISAAIRDQNEAKGQRRVEETMTAQMNAQTGSAPSQKQQSAEAQRQDVVRREHTNLSGRYGSIGIQSVAAAVRYAGARKNPAYAPVVTHIESRRYENAV
jgi:hypothetical protein